jgi:hypothetical protein
MLFSIILTNIFLIINHPYSAFSSPTEPKRGVALDLMHLTVAKNIPQNDCPRGTEWHSRNCEPWVSDRAWEDFCHIIGTTDPMDFEYVTGACPENTMCQDTFTSDNIETVACLKRPTTQTQLEPGEQSGVYKITNAHSVPAQRIISVKIEKDLAHASVSALMEGVS